MVEQDPGRADSHPQRPPVVVFEAIYYEERPFLLRFLGRRRVRQDIGFHLAGDSVIITLPPPVAFRFELTTTPRKFAELIGRLCGTP